MTRLHILQCVAIGGYLARKEEESGPWVAPCSMGLGSLLECTQQTNTGIESHRTEYRSGITRTT